MTQEASTGGPDTGEGRAALLEAAVRVIARDGFDGLTYRAVGQEAGTAHGLVSYYFGSREALIHEAAQWASRRAIESANLLAGAEVTDFARDLAASVEQDLDAHMFQYELDLQARRRPAIGREMQSLYRVYCELTLDSLRRMGIDASPALARLVFAALDGIVLQQVVDQDQDRTQQTLAALHHVLRILAGAPPAGDE